MSLGPKIVVIGATYLDACFQLSHMPKKNRTQNADEARLMLGGKGLNQAVASSRLGGDATFVTSIGSDAISSLVRRQLLDEGLRVESLFLEEARGYELPIVALHTLKDSMYVVTSPSDGVPPPPITQLVRARDEILTADAILVTCDYFKYLLFALVDILPPRGARGPVLILNPAPTRSRGYVPSSLLRQMDWIVPNRWEAERLLGRPVPDDGDLCLALARVTAGNVCITLGAKGCVYTNPEAGSTASFEPAIRVVAADANGASDAFCAALAVWLAEGADSAEAVRAAVVAGSLSTECFGTSTSMPTLPTVKAIVEGLSGGAAPSTI
jgi:ribokinase